MADIISTFFQITGVSTTAPAALSELIPYMLTVFICLVLVIAVFKVIGSVINTLLYSSRRF